MKILMTKFPPARNEKYNLITTIFEQNGERFVKKSAATKTSLPHLRSFKKKALFLNENILNPKLTVNKILFKDDNSLTFEYIKDPSFEKIIHSALSQNKQQTFKSLINEYCTLLKTSLKLLSFDDVNVILPEKIKNIYAKYSMGFIQAKVPFDLTPGNIFKKFDGSFEIIDYEWTFHLPLPLEFILFRALYYCILNFNSNILEGVLDIPTASGGMPYTEFQIIENLVMNKIVPYKHLKLKKHTSKSAPVQKFAQLYLNYGKGFSESMSIKYLLDFTKETNTFSFNLKKQGLSELRFDPLNEPCSTKINSITFNSKGQEIYKTSNLQSNGLKDSKGIHYFNSSDPQFFINNIPNQILQKTDEIIIQIEYISFGDDALDLYAEQIKHLCDLLNMEIDQHLSTIDNLQKKINELNFSLNLTNSALDNKTLALNTADTEINNLNDQISEKNSIIKFKEKQLNEKLLKLQNIQINFENISSKLDATKKKQDSILELLHKKEKELAELEKKSSSQKKKLKSDILFLKNKENSYLSNITKLENDISLKNNDISLLDNRLKIIENELKNLYASHDVLNNKLIQRDITILEFRKSIHEFKSSRSWRMTAPYRKLDAIMANLIGDKNGTL